MADKINGQGYRPLDTTGTSRKPSVQDGQAASRSAGTGTQATGDTVNFTRSGLLLGRLEELVTNVPVVNEERVDAIRQALASGAYEIDARSLASKLLEFEKGLV